MTDQPTTKELVAWLRSMANMGYQTDWGADRYEAVADRLELVDKVAGHLTQYECAKIEEIAAQNAGLVKALAESCDEGRMMCMKELKLCCPASADLAEAMALLETATHYVGLYATEEEGWHDRLKALRERIK